MYNEFHEQFLDSHAYYKKKVAEDGGRTQYIVGKYDINKLKWKTVVHDLLW